MTNDPQQRLFINIMKADMGASAERAVEIASQYDIYTGGRITALPLTPSRPKEEAK